MAKLHELLAVEGDLEGTWKKIMAETIVTLTKKVTLFFGFVRNLVMFDENRKNENDVEHKTMSTTVAKKMEYMWISTMRYFNAIAQKEATNQLAKADLIVDGKVLIKDMPATLLLGLESRLRQMREVYAVLPTLPPNIEWEDHPDMGEGVYRSAHTEDAFKTETGFKAQILYEARFPKEGEGGSSLPAQVEKISETKNIGKYEKTHWTGVLPPVKKMELMERLDKLTRAVKQARQRANSTPVVKLDIGSILRDYIHKN